ncbi:MAG: translation initiation factor IF-2 [Candidatus Altiarchaeales archaeon ex4484_43]|nr:MAG: translation initiation factor IF-2 [Candidatus Altiarchaeales archaeon ex4484_43]
MPETKIREPIISVLGHIDHGKTTLLDWIRGTVIASREVGGITQHIGATDVPFETINEICGPLLDRVRHRIDIRGLLFIDTPGHEAFTNLRKRGGSVADLAIVVVDINEGLMPQTIEAINILKQNRVPFVVAANKIDMIHGWNSNGKVEDQQQHVKDEFYKKFYKLVSQLSERGFDSDLFSNIHDFTKQIAIVPISAKNGNGIPELLMILMGLAQQYLTKRLTIGRDTPGKGTILEVKEERGLGTTIDVILYEGIIRRGDQIVVGSKEPILTKVKALLKPKPLDEMRDPRDRFENVPEVCAASGVKISAPNLEHALAGAPVYVGDSEMVEKIKREIEDVEIHTDTTGVVLKADTIGSLEALINTLKEKNIPIKRATIGKVSNSDVIEASAVSLEDKFLGVILAFNSDILRDARILAKNKNVEIFHGRIIYKLLEDYEDWIKRERERERLEKEGKIVTPAKIRLLPKHVFRQSKPAIVGVEVLAGTIASGCRLMREDGRVVGRIKQIQLKRETIKSATTGERVAIAIEGVTMGRQLNENDTVYTFISSEDMKLLSEGELTEEELAVLREIRRIKKGTKTG